MIGELRLKLDGMQREIDSQQTTVDTGDAYLARFRADMAAVGAVRADPKALKAAVRNLYHQYAAPAGHDAPSSATAGQQPPQSEYDRQREQLERAVESLRRSIAKDVDQHASERLKLERERELLLEQLRKS